MRFGSVCSGIEAASVAFTPLGWEAAWLAEIEPFPAAVLAHHYPEVPNLGDMTTIPRRLLAGEIDAPDMLCGGTPCQAFSIAGLRESLSDERGNLTLKFVEIADAIDHVRARRGEPPAIVLWENVPGVLSTRDNAFGCFLAGLAGEDDPLQPPGEKWANAGCVYGPARAVAWRTLDAQYFGLAQRRRRVFVVASSRDGFDPATVLFEWDGVRRDSAPRREAGKVAPTIPSRSTGGGGLGTDFDLDGGVIQAVAPTLDASFGRLQGCSGQDANHGHGHLIAQAFGGNNQSGPIEVATARNASASASGRNNGGENVLAFDTTQITSAENRSNPQPGGPCHPLSAGAHPPAIAIQAGALRTNPASGPDGVGVQADHAYTLEARSEVQCVQVAQQVRRLTPRECERLQGFPEIVKTCTITVFKHSNSNVCPSDQQSTNVLAALQSHKSPNNALPAEENVFLSNANAAELNLNAGQESLSAPVLVNVQIDLERQHLQLHSQGKLLLSVSIADVSEWCRLPIQAADFVQLSAALLTWLERKAPHGKAESRLSTSGSFPLLIGNLFASQSGQEIEELASDAEKFISAVKNCMKSITSEAGRNSQNYDLILQTLLCCVSTAISSFIPKETRAASSYALSVEVSHGYTRIPWRKKPVSDCPDGLRYKALGNSWAVPCVRWIGRRIQDVNEIQSTRGDG